MRLALGPPGIDPEVILIVVILDNYHYRLFQRDYPAPISHLREGTTNRPVNVWNFAAYIVANFSFLVVNREPEDIILSNRITTLFVDDTRGQ